MAESGPASTASEVPSRVRLYGAGGHSRVVASILEALGSEVVTTFEDRPPTRHRATVNVQPGVRLDGDRFPSEGPPLIITIGNNGERAEISRMVNATFTKALHPTAVIDETVSVGEGTVVHHGSVIQANTIIGKHVLINTAASIDHDNLIHDYAHVSPHATLCGHVEIGEGTHVGAAVTVIQKVKIGKWCTIGAGTVVIEDVPDYSTVVGNPGRVIKTGPPSGLVNPVPSRKDFDITFVGSGISSTFTLLDLLDELTEAETQEKVRIAIVEKSTDFFTGLPYGERSGESALTITSLGDFVPARERESFLSWLIDNRTWLVAYGRRNTGMAAPEWLEGFEQTESLDGYEDLYIPRRFFGMYVEERANQALEAAHNAGLVDFELIQAEVLGIERPVPDTYQIRLAKGSDFETKRVVLAVGSTPIRPQFNAEKSASACLIDNVYEPSLVSSIGRVRDIATSQPVRALVIGANASALEVIHQLRDDRTITERLESVCVISPGGRLPDPVEPPEDHDRFEPRQLLKLETQATPTAEDVGLAALGDLADAEAAGIPVGVSFGPVSQQMGAMLGRLDRGGKLQFAQRFGNEIGRRQRRAGPQYLGAVAELVRAGRFEHLAGTFVGIREQDGQTFARYRSTNDGEVLEVGTDFNVVINCGAPTSFGGPDLPPLLAQLVESGLTTANESGRGLDVDGRLQAADALYVIGPMLAGNVVLDMPVWHVEHCGRIANFAGHLADILHKDLRNAPVEATASR